MNREMLTQTTVLEVLAVRSINTAVNDKLILQYRVLLRNQIHKYQLNNQITIMYTVDRGLDIQ